MAGEFDLIRRFARALGPAAHTELMAGDDAAVVRLGGTGVCLATDVLVEGVHFRLDVSTHADVGWKAVAVNVSDLAAMGATPRAGVVGLGVPATVSATDLEMLYRGMGEAARRWGVPIVGGDTVAAPALTVAFTVLGEVDPDAAVARAGATPGDAVVVVGALGAAAAALAQLAAGLNPEPDLLAAHRRPVALPAAGAVLASAGATAMIDVSDGLGADLAHLCRASRVHARIDLARLPVAEGLHEAARAAGTDPLRLICGGGEDFALVATLPAVVAGAAAERAGAAEGVAAAVVGEIIAAGSHPLVTLVDDVGRARDISALGYDHFPEER